jgi:DNA topoisomerase-1
MKRASTEPSRSEHVSPVTVVTVDAARRAGLRYGVDDGPGIRRRRCGRGFTYRDVDGGPVDDSTRRRVEQMAIPPAWTSVWISPDPDNHLQATGIDDKGRKQYRYHDRWRTARDEAKFDGLVEFGDALGEIRRRVALDLQGSHLGRDRAAAAVVRLLDTTLIRVGSERYASENETFGATTLEPAHVRRTGTGCRLEFVGKSGIEHLVEVTDPSVVAVITESARLRQPQLFCFVDDGIVRDLNATHVNQYLADTAGACATAKTFRTWGATVRAVDHLGRSDTDGPPARRLLAAIDAAAASLGNTRAVCRSSYVAPAVARAVESGALDDAWSSSRSGRWRSRAEHATTKILR